MSESQTIPAPPVPSLTDRDPTMGPRLVACGLDKGSAELVMCRPFRDVVRAVAYVEKPRVALGVVRELLQNPPLEMTVERDDALRALYLSLRVLG